MSEKIEKLVEIKDKEWEKVDKWNKNITEEFLEQEQLSPQTLKQYKSALRQFFYWVYENCDNKPLHELKVRDALKYQNYLIKRGLSSSAVKLKRSVVSSLCGFMETYYDDEFPMFKNIFNKKVPGVPNSFKREKKPLIKDELENLIKELKKRKEWQMLAYLVFSYESGARRGEVSQVRKEIIDYDYVKDKKGNKKDYYMTHTVRGKGKGREGKKIELFFSDDSKKVIKKWLDVRGDDDCEYLFVKKNSNGDVEQVTLETFNYWCSKTFSEIVGREVYPHLLRTSRASGLFHDGSSVKSISALLGHKQTSTTEIYIIQDDSDLIDDIFDH